MYSWYPLGKYRRKGQVWFLNMATIFIFMFRVGETLSIILLDHFVRAATRGNILSLKRCLVPPLALVLFWLPTLLGDQENIFSWKARMTKSQNPHPDITNTIICNSPLEGNYRGELQNNLYPSLIKWEISWLERGNPLPWEAQHAYMECSGSSYCMVS